jgi:hypothetical protein
VQTADVVHALLGADQFSLAAVREVYNALRVNRLLSFQYDDQLRVAEAHSLGITKDGKLAVRAYQTAGESSQPLPGWRMFRLDKIRDAKALATESQAPREGFKPNDKHLAHILLEIAA